MDLLNSNVDVDFTEDTTLISFQIKGECRKYYNFRFLFTPSIWAKFKWHEKLRFRIFLWLVGKSTLNVTDWDKTESNA